MSPGFPEFRSWSTPIGVAQRSLCLCSKQHNKRTERRGGNWAIVRTKVTSARGFLSCYSGSAPGALLGGVRAPPYRPLLNSDSANQPAMNSGPQRGPGKNPLFSGGAPRGGVLGPQTPLTSPWDRPHPGIQAGLFVQSVGRAATVPQNDPGTPRRVPPLGHDPSSSPVGDFSRRHPCFSRDPGRGLLWVARGTWPEARFEPPPDTPPGGPVGGPWASPLRGRSKIGGILPSPGLLPKDFGYFV